MVPSGGSIESGPGENATRVRGSIHRRGAGSELEQPARGEASSGGAGSTRVQQVGDWPDIRKQRAQGRRTGTERCDQTPRQTVAKTFAFCWAAARLPAPASPAPAPARPAAPPATRAEEVPVEKVPLVGPEGGLASPSAEALIV